MSSFKIKTASIVQEKIHSKTWKDYFGIQMYYTEIFSLFWNIPHGLQVANLKMKTENMD